MHRDLGYAQTSISHDFYRIYDTIKIVALKAGQAVQGLPVYDVRIGVQEDPAAIFERRIIIQIVHDPMPNTVNLDDKAPKQMEPVSYNLQSARLIRD